MTTDAGAGAQLDVTAGLSLNIGRLADQLQAERRDRQRELNDQPRYIQAAAFGTVPASGVLTVGLSGPKTGYEWTLRRVTFTDATLAYNTLGGSAAGYIYAGAISGTQNVQPENLVWIMPVLPNVATFGSDQILLQYTEHLYVQLVGGTPNQTVKCSIAYQLYQAGRARRNVEV